jgi:hypothetical protein
MCLSLPLHVSPAAQPDVRSVAETINAELSGSRAFPPCPANVALVAMATHQGHRLAVPYIASAFNPLSNEFQEVPFPAGTPVAALFVDSFGFLIGFVGEFPVLVCRENWYLALVGAEDGGMQDV